jgi:ABC-type lipoprotein release transport system permease subunit
MWTRRLTTVLTVGGLSLVVFVFAAVLMLAHGIEKTLISTGSEDNVIVLRKSATAELMSQIDRETVEIIKSYPEVALTPDGKPFAANELFVIINMLKKTTNNMGNVTVRGVTKQSLMLRPWVKITEGRMLTWGSTEIMIGSNIAKHFNGCEIGSKIKFAQTYWTVVGIFDGNGTGFDSEIWGDVDQIMPAFGRPVYSSLTLHLRNLSDFESIRSKVEADRRINFVEVKHEQKYYAEQSEFMAIFIRVVGTAITIIFSFGAMIGAMITMYATVANRTVEIGTLRALGFRRRNILTAFLVESICLSLIASLIGLVAASFLQLFVISTINFGSFAELSFGFNMSGTIIGWTVVFAVIMGIVGGFLPAVRASRLNIVNALRSS